jgi:wyosine [tRNA(Phe)-imidazoG37] synthetase (radical SAM superfamily)
MSNAVLHPTVDCKRDLSGTAFGCPRNFLDNQFVYAVLSARARGLSVGVNMNPDKLCNFDCAYCEINRQLPGRRALDVDVMAAELETTLALVHSAHLRQNPSFAALPDDLLKLKHVALSGDGEPTLCPLFLDAVQAVMHVRATTRVPFFKIVLITNSSHLDAPEVQQGLKLFTKHDEVWAKLEAGTQAYMDRINVTDVSIEAVTENILRLARQRPVIIQSLFPLLDGTPPSAEEIETYAQRLRQLKDAGANIPLVQIYSATRPMARSLCGHLPLRVLSQIAQTVRRVSGLHAEVF